MLILYNAIPITKNNNNIAMTLSFILLGKSIIYISNKYFYRTIILYKTRQYPSLLNRQKLSELLY